MKASRLLIFSLLVSTGAFATDPPASNPPASDPLNGDIVLTDLSSVVTDPFSSYCDYGVKLEPTLQGILNDFVTKCDDKVEAALNIPDLDQRLRSFKEIACPCYNSYRPTSLDDITLQGMNESTRRRVTADVRGDSIVSAPAIDQNIKTQNILLNEQRNGVMIQASILSPDPQERDALTRGYAGRSDFDRMILGANKGLFDSTKNLPDSSDIKATFSAPGYDDSSLHSNGANCPSMREFRHFRQFPEDNEFYRDLLNARNSTYVPNDWNFEKLKEQLASVTKSKNILSLDSAKSDPDAAWLIRRMDFLMRNPLLKNFFQQGGISKRKREHLFELVQQSFKPEQGSGSCLNVPGACQGAAGQRAHFYQTGLREFFKDPDVVRRVVSLDVDSMEKTLESLPKRVTTTPVIPSANDLSNLSPWMDKIMGMTSYGASSANRSINSWRAATAGVAAISPVTMDLNGFNFPGVDLSSVNGTMNLYGQRATNQDLSDSSVSESLHRSVRLGDINQTCNMLSDTNLNRHGFIFAQLEQEWSKELCDPSKPINGEFCTNPALIEMSGKLCSRFKPNSNDVMTIQDYRASGGCSDPSKNCLAEFITHSRAILPESEQTAANFATVLYSAKISSMSQQESARVGATVNRNNSLSERDYVNTASSDVVRDLNNISRPATVNKSPATTAPASSSVAATSSASNQLTPAVNSQQIADVQLPISGSGAATVIPSTPREIIREQARSESDAQGIRDEMAELQNSLLRAKEAREANASSDSAERIATLEANLTRLQEKLDAQNALTNRLRNQLARTPSDPVPAAAPSNSQNVQSNDRIASSPVTPQVQAAPQGGQQSGGSASLGGISGLQPSASLNSVGGRTSPGTVSRSGSPSGIDSALRSKYGIQSASGGPSGAITVGNEQGLSESRKVELPLSQEEFQRISNDNEAAKNYIDRCPAGTDLCRLSFSVPGSTEELDILVRIAGNEVSIIPSNGASRGIASESAPIPENAPGRDTTLEQLRQELGR